MEKNAAVANIVIHWARESEHASKKSSPGQRAKIQSGFILQGSRAAGVAVDPLSDYDMTVFCSTSAPYTGTEDWLNQMGIVWVCVKEQIPFCGKNFPSRLVIFEGGVKVDFSVTVQIPPLQWGPCPIAEGGAELLHGKKRKLGIPTVSDRIAQMIYCGAVIFCVFLSSQSLSD